MGYTNVSFNGAAYRMGYTNVSFNGAAYLKPGNEPKWEPYYTWVPKKVNGKWYWLTTIYRKKNIDYGDQRFPPPRYIYGDEFDVLKE
jgi:hypothetical protein